MSPIHAFFLKQVLTKLLYFKYDPFVTVKSQDMLEQLVTPEKDSSFYRLERIAFLYKHIPFGFMAQCFLGTVIMVMNQAQAQVQSNWNLFWVVYLVTVMSLWLGSYFLFARKPGIFRPGVWLGIFFIFSFLSGLTWVLAVNLFLPYERPLQQLTDVVLIIGLVGGAVPFMAIYYQSYMAFALPIMASLSWWLLQTGGEYTYLGYCAIMYTFSMIVTCLFSHQFLVQTFNLRDANLQLDEANHLLQDKLHTQDLALERNLALTKSTLESSQDGICVVNMQGNIELSNHRFYEIWSLEENRTHGHSFVDFLNQLYESLDNPEIFATQVSYLMSSLHDERHGELLLKDGRVIEWSSSPHEIEHSHQGRIWSFRDISQHKKMEQELAYQNLHDITTGLPNRLLLQERLFHDIEHAKRYGLELVLIYLDIDQFRLVNNHIGHKEGDFVLKRLGERLQSCVKASDTVARLSSDEFVIIILIERGQFIPKIIQKVQSMVATPIYHSQKQTLLTASIGVSCFPKDAITADNLLRNADLAMCKAKNNGGNRYVMFEPSLRSEIHEDLQLQMDLRTAVVDEAFVLVYQPIFDLNKMTITGVEALLRWNHPEKGLLSPAVFIEVAEHSGIMINIGQWVIKQALRQIQTWQKQGLPTLPITINVAAIQLSDTQFADTLLDLLKEYDVKPELVVLELTERSFMKSTEANQEQLAKLVAMGIKIYIDDFGTGFSNMSYLRKFPVDKIKIATEFVHDCLTEKDARAIVQGMLALSKELKIAVIAEGIETAEELNFLKNQHCEEGQGYFLCRPLFINELQTVLRDPKQARNFTSTPLS